jgi:hypothetical protein
VPEAGPALVLEFQPPTGSGISCEFIPGVHLAESGWRSE